MRVLLITTWGTACGIAEHSRELKAAVEAADPAIEIVPDVRALDPHAFWTDARELPDLVHLNYHAALHARWTPAQITRLRAHVPVLVTYHDTGVPNSDQCRSVAAAASAVVIHEPAEDLPGAHYWRMGVPAPASPILFVARTRSRLTANHCFKAWPDQPVLGSIGFPFPWKHFDLLAEITREIGWALLLIAPTATPEQVAHWQAINPDSYIRTDFVPAREALSLLTGCDATAFPYVCHNTGQSGAILQGIAARKPVLAFSTCRQFRALVEDPRVHGVWWAETVEELRDGLATVPITGKPFAPMVALAEQESWARLGRKYAGLYRELVAETGEG